MKTFLFFLSLTATLPALADFTPGERSIRKERTQTEFGIFEYPEVGYCRYDVLGPQGAPDSTIEPELMDFKSCETKAKRALKSKKEALKVYVKHQSKPDFIIIEK